MVNELPYSFALQPETGLRMRCGEASNFRAPRGAL